MKDENVLIKDGETYIAVDSKNGTCNCCSFIKIDCMFAPCHPNHRADKRDVIWIKQEPAKPAEWTPADEAKLAELTERKRVFFDKHMDEVKNLVSKPISHAEYLSVSAAISLITQYMIDNARAFRKVLEPYDQTKEQ